MKLKYWIIGSPALLIGCAQLDWLIGAPGESSGVVDVVTDLATNSGNPPLVVAGLAISTLAAIARGIYHKRTTKEIVLSVQAGYDKLKPEQRDMALKEVSKRMPESVKKTVAKIKSAL